MAQAFLSRPEAVSLYVAAALAIAASIGGGIKYLIDRRDKARAQEAGEEDAQVERIVRTRESDRAFMIAQYQHNNDELARTREELKEVVPTISAIRKEYAELTEKNIELMDQMLQLKADQVAERRKYLAMIGGISMQMNDLRRYFAEATGLVPPATHDPLDILAEAEAAFAATGEVLEPLPRPPAPRPPEDIL